MTITPSSLAAINGVTVENQAFAVTAQVVPQKNVIIGYYDEDNKTGIVQNVPMRVFSAEDVGAQTGFGFMLHRLAKYAFKPGAVETWIIPQPQDYEDTYAEGVINFNASIGVLAGTLALFIAGERVAVTITDAMTGADIADAVVEAIGDDDTLPVTAEALGAVVTLTAKSAGSWGNYIRIDWNLDSGDETPTGVLIITDVALAGGGDNPPIQDALDALGTGDAQNEGNFTNVIHGYGYDVVAVPNAISTYNGIGNLDIGNYKKEVGRPFRCLSCDTVKGTVKLGILLALADVRRLDRTNGLLCAPDSPNHPAEIAAQATGIMAVTNSIRAEEGYIDKALLGIYPGEDRYTDDFDTRDQMVKGGLGTTRSKNGVLYLQNVITFYRPEDIPAASNGYRPMRNISIIQNMLYNYRLNFERSKWKGVTLVEDTAKVSNVLSRQKARDVESVKDDLINLADVFAGNAWLYTASYTKKNFSVTMRDGLTGFDIIFPVIVSGEIGIYNSLITFDTSIAILLGGE